MDRQSLDTHGFKHFQKVQVLGSLLLARIQPAASSRHGHLHGLHERGNAMLRQTDVFQKRGPGTGFS